MEDSLEEGESQSNSAKLPLLFEDEGTASHCDLKKMEEQRDDSEANKNVVQNEREELCKVVPECIQNNSATKVSYGESAGDCSNEAGIMSECANENREKGKGVEGIEHVGENIQSKAGCADESETSSEKLDAGKENASNENGDIFEGVREVSGSYFAMQEGESDVSKSNEEKAAGNAVHTGSESNVNSDSGGFENEENNQNMSSLILEGDENEANNTIMSLPDSEGDANREDIQNMNSFDSSGDGNEISLYLSSSSDMEVSENEETMQAVNSSATEGDENEETSHTLSNSAIESSEYEETSQAVSNSATEVDEHEDTSQSVSNSAIGSSENEETRQAVNNSAINGDKNEETSQAVNNSAIEGNKNEETSQAVSNSAIEDVENEETSQAVSNSAIEDVENEETSPVNSSAIEDVENEETSPVNSSAIEDVENEETSQTVNSSAIEDVENEETSQTVSSSVIEDDRTEKSNQAVSNSVIGSENEKTSQAVSNSAIESVENEETRQTMSNSAVEGDETEETNQAVSSSIIAGGETEETRQAVNSSNLDGNENEDVCQSTIESGLQDNGNRGNNQSRASSGLENEESEENGQMMCSAGMESNENENCQVVTGSVMEDNENGNTLIRMKDGDRMEVVNEKGFELGHNMNFPDGEKENSVLSEEDIQESSKGVSTEEETGKSPGSFTKETQGCLGAEESRLRNTQEHSMKSIVEEENIANSNNYVQNAEINEEQEQDFRIITEKEGKDPLEMESRRKGKDEELQSEVEQEEMEAEGSIVESEELDKSKGGTIQGEDEENKTPRGAENGRMCEKEQLQMEEGNIDMQEMNAKKENDKTQESVDKELRQSNEGDAIAEESDVNRSRNGNTTDHDKPDQDAHNLDQLDMNEQSLKLTSEAKSKPQQEKTDTNMHKVTLSEDMQNQTGAKEITGKDIDQPEDLNVTKDILNQANKHGLADKHVNEKANTSQESTLEETSQNQNEIGSASSKNKKNEVSYRSREEDRRKEVMVQQNASTSQATGETSSKCDNSRTVKHKDTVTAALAYKVNVIYNKKPVTGKVLPDQPNIAKKSTSKLTPRAAVHKQQPSTQKTQSGKQDAEDSDDSDIVVLSETIMTPSNPARFTGMALVCHTCNHLWNNEVLSAIFDGNKCVTVNSKITYGAIICFSNYADLHYPLNKDVAVRNILERADLSKNIGNMKINEVLEWLKYLMRSGSVTCCTVFDAVYNPRSTDAILSALLSPKPAIQEKNETPKSKNQNADKVKKKTPQKQSSCTSTQKQSSCTSKTKHKAGTSSRTTTSSPKTTGAKKITPSRLSEAKKFQRTTSERPVTSSKDDSQSLNKNYVIKKCSVYLGKPVTVSSQQNVCSPVSSSSARSSATKRSLTEEEDKTQSRKKGRSLRRSLNHEDSTDTNSSSETSVKDAVELPMDENSTTDSEYISKSFSRDSNEDDTVSDWSESILDALENEESSLESSSDIVTTKSSNQLASKSMTDSEPRAKKKEDIVGKDQIKAEQYRKGKTKLPDKSKTAARHKNKYTKRSNKKPKIGKTNNKDERKTAKTNSKDERKTGKTNSEDERKTHKTNSEVAEKTGKTNSEDAEKTGKTNSKDAGQTLTHKAVASPDGVVSSIIKSQENSRNIEKHDLQSTKATNSDEKTEQTITEDAEVEKHVKSERNEETNKTDTNNIKCSNRKEKTGKDADQTLAHKPEASLDDTVSDTVNSQNDNRNTEKHDLQSTEATDRNETAEETITKDTKTAKHDKIEGNEEAITKDTEVKKHDESERNEEANKTDVETERREKNDKTEDVNIDEDETKDHDKNYESEKRSVKDSKAEHEKHKRNEEVMEDAEIERHESSEDVIMKDADIKRHDNTKIGETDMTDAEQVITEKQVGEINMTDAEQVVTEKQVMSTVESIGNTGEHEDPSEKAKRHAGKNIKPFSVNTEHEDVNMKDANEQTVTEKQNIPSGVSSENSFTNQTKRSAEGSSTHSPKRQKVSDGTREEPSKDTEIQETKHLTKAMEGVPSKLQRRTRTRLATQRFCSTDSKESDSSMPASIEGMESTPSSELTPNCESSDEFEENTSKARLVSKEKVEEKLKKSPRVLRSRSQRAVSKKTVSSSETSSDSNDQPVSTGDSVPQSRSCRSYQPVPSTKSNEESENILVQKLGLNISAIDLFCNTTDSKMPTNKDMANMPRQRGRFTKALEAMFRERSNLDGVAKEAFDLLPFENHNVIGTASNKERYLTNQELLVLQNICVLNPEAPDVDMFYQILIQMLLARRQVLLVPNSLALLVVAEKVRREFNRAKRKGNHSEYLAHNWDPSKIYTTEDFWLVEKKPPRVPTVRTVLSIFCLWKNLEKRVPISLPIALEELCRNLVLCDVDKIGMCVKLYSRYCTFLYEEKNPSLTEIFLNQPFIGSKTKMQKKLLYSRENTSGNFSSKHVIENDVQALLKQCLEAEQAALRSSNPREEEWFRKCVQALKDKVDAYKKEIQLIQKVTKDTEKKKFQLLSKLNSSEDEDFPQDLGKTTETLYRMLAKRTTKFEMLKEAECSAAKETMKVARLSPSVLKAADLGEYVSESMKELVYELLFNKVAVEEVRPVLCILVENMTNNNILDVPSNSWIRNFARITGMKVKSRNNIVL